MSPTAVCGHLSTNKCVPLLPSTANLAEYVTPPYARVDDCFADLFNARLERAVDNTTKMQIFTCRNKFEKTPQYLKLFGNKIQFRYCILNKI